MKKTKEIQQPDWVQELIVLETFEVLLKNMTQQLNAKYQQKIKFDSILSYTEDAAQITISCVKGSKVFSITEILTKQAVVALGSNLEYMGQIVEKNIDKLLFELVTN